MTKQEKVIELLDSFVEDNEPAYLLYGIDTTNRLHVVIIDNLELYHDEDWFNDFEEDLRKNTSRNFQEDLIIVDALYKDQYIPTMDLIIYRHGA